MDQTIDRHEYAAISSRALSLLNRSESYELEFKENLQALEPEDLVAFANSPQGGVVLVGVREREADNGRQRGAVVGCPVGDPEKLSIVNKAESCVPPIAIAVIVENADRKPFFRVEIPSGPNKPYATAAGTYKIRGDGRTLPLLPSRLLAIFMASENREFVERFRAATRELERDVADTKARLMEETNRLLQSLALLDQKLEATLTSHRPADRGGAGQVADLAEIAALLARKIDALLDAVGTDDPCEDD
ncbi:MAG: ATP-binding protein [Anaerolineae bacterium]|jgi:predicted HTH transcriptional regulator